MTRTERATHPRAIIKDRSESKSGLDKSVKKSGAGPHAWGSLKDEVDHEFGAEEDEGLEYDEEGDRIITEEPVGKKDSKKGDKARRESDAQEEEAKVKARDIRTGMRKNGDPLDLDSIARTSNAVSGSPPRSRNEVVPVNVVSDAPTTAGAEF